MTREKNNKKRIVKSLIVGSLLILIGVIIFGYDKAENNKKQKEDNSMIEEFFHSIKKTKKSDTKKTTKVNQENYIAIIEIPKINLKTGMVDPSSKSNSVNSHVQILDGSDMPSVENGNFILASHSGTSNVSYFKKLNKLKNEDIVYIYYEDIKYTYQVFNIDKINKNGKLTVNKYKNQTLLTLTTCDTNDNTKQLVVSLKQVDKKTFRGN